MAVNDLLYCKVKIGLWIHGFTNFQSGKQTQCASRLLSCLWKMLKFGGGGIALNEILHMS